MKNKDLQKLLAQYPDDAVVTATYTDITEITFDGKVFSEVKYPLLESEVHYAEGNNSIQILFDEDREEQCD